jgi:hypothetical protein
MADQLNGSVYSTGTAAITGLQWSFTVAEDDDLTPTLVDCAIALRLFKLTGVPKSIEAARQLPPAPDGPHLALNLTSGLARDTNLAKSQSGLLTISASSANTLLGSANAVGINYFWVVTPVGAAPLAKPLGEEYQGTFILLREGYDLEALAKIK